uniref:Uncharacterized protein n=1 Tax=Araucaria cunninghamii TaxID=56994 RepID=A0A0D6R0A7_ARACU
MLHSFPGFKCSLSALVWSMVAWILIIHIYTAFNPKPETPMLHTRVSRHPLHREFEEIEEKGYGIKIRSKINPSNSGKRKGKKFSPNNDFFNIARGSFLFPDRSLAVNPLRSDGNDTGYFYPGREWLDTDGKPIQAHGGGILYVEETGTFYWYGENKDGPTYHAHKRGAARVDIIGVSCYSSKDLWTWKNEGIVLSPVKYNTTHDLHESNVLERPKVIYNNRTKKYVMWMHIDNVNYTKASVGVAVSTSPVGPFRYLGSKRPHGFDSRDMTVFKDDDGKAYIIYSSEDNSELHVGLLTEDYTNIARIMRRALVGQHREAPAVFKHGNLYYMVTSGCTGWAPNQASAHAAESMLGPWETLGNPSVGGNADLRATTFWAQGTFVLPLPGIPDTFIFMADRWNPPDLRNSRYVWLPLIVDGPAEEPLEYEFGFPVWSRVSIYWHKRWKLPEGWNLPLPNRSV